MMVMSNTKLAVGTDMAVPLNAQIERQQTMLNRLRIEVEQERGKLRKVKKDLRDLDIQRIFDNQRSDRREAAQTEIKAKAALKRLYQLSRYSQHDVLTGMPNRALMMDRLENAIALANRNHYRMAILFVDVDRFKSINDHYGHAMGDEVLKWLSERLVGAVRQSDTVSRHGGDEFLILLPQIESAKDALIIANKVVAAINESCNLNGHSLMLATSIGIAIFPEQGADPDSLIQQADKAMYQAKSNGGQQCHLLSEPVF